MPCTMCGIAAVSGPKTKDDWLDYHRSLRDRSFAKTDAFFAPFVIPEEIDRWQTLPAFVGIR
jgi:hypothetical protein